MSHSDMRLPEPALVVFVGRADCRWLGWLRAGFRHCFVALRLGSMWLTCDSLKDRIELSALPIPANFDLAGFYADRGHAVLAGQTAPGVPRRPFAIAPLTCVTVAKRLLGLRAAWVLTPWQLYRHLTAEGHGFVAIPAKAGRRAAIPGLTDPGKEDYKPINVGRALPGHALSDRPCRSKSSEPACGVAFMGELSLEAVWSRFQRAKARRRCWESLWRDCYTYALPQRGAGFDSAFRPGANPAERLFDGTALDAVDQLGASLLAELTPPWSQWFGFIPGREIGPLERGLVAESLDRVTLTVQAHFDRSNFAVEMHQAFLDLVTVGNATLLFEEAPVGAPTAFRLTAVPMSEIAFEAAADGHIDGHFRERSLPLDLLLARFPGAELPPAIVASCQAEPERSVTVVEAVLPGNGGFAYVALLADSSPVLLATGHFACSPFISFRWLKGAGEIYGRSPVMAALPDIKTANKVVELILKNASIAVTGIWLADDDGVLNPANIRLVPGSIIPKAVGSAGLTPLQAPGRFDVSNLVLEDLRARIRHALLVDRLGPVGGPRMTATEVAERSAETTRLLGATYGRLQAELTTPLLNRAIAILRRRGEIPPITLDGREVDLHYKSPLARSQARQDIRETLMWLEAAARMGDEATAVVDIPATARWLADRLGVPGQLVRDLASPQVLLDGLNQVIEQVAADQVVGSENAD